MKNTNNVYVVTYFDINEKEPVVTVFDNKKTAKEYFDYVKMDHDVTSMDDCPVYSAFTLDLSKDAGSVQSVK